ncbi:MAG: hypothetical protein ACE5JI_23145, partial [Acidobacteriota bacterium]
MKAKVYLPTLFRFVPVLIFSWLFFQWPQVSNFPRSIQEAEAATIAQDTFTEAANAFLENHTPDIGTGWSAEPTQNLEIDAATDELGNNVGGAPSYGREGSDMTQDDVFAQCDCMVTATGNSVHSGIMVRMANTGLVGADGFVGRIEGSNNAARLVIAKWVNENETILATTATDSHSLNTVYTLKLEATNEGGSTRLKLFVNGVETLNVLESTDPMQGVNNRRAGLQKRKTGSLDNWSSGTISACSPVSDAAYVAAIAQNGQATVYWSSP